MAWYNNAICDIYIGKGAGRKLMNDIENAQKSVKIVSPYLSPSMVELLIDLYNKKIKVSLITSDDIEDYYGSYEKNIYKLITQEKITDIQAQEQREKWKKISKYLLFGIISFVVILISAFYFYQNIKIFYGVFFILVIALIRKIFFEDKIKNKRIYNYRYHQLFPFKVYTSYNQSKDYNDTLIHGKIYIIDDKIAYMGSVNFTKSAIKFNYETRIRTTDNKALKVIVKEFYDLFNNPNLSERNIQNWGKQLYKEPIN